MSVDRSPPAAATAASPAAGPDEMHAVWYERTGPAAEVLQLGRLPRPEPGAGEVRIRLSCSAVNPGDVKKRTDAFGYGLRFARVVPHSDGAGIIDRVGSGVDPRRVGERVWCHGAQRYRAGGTAAESVVVPQDLAVPLPDGVPLALGACLGIPGLTAHRAVHCAEALEGRTVLVHGGAGAVGSLACGLARLAGARVLATVRRLEDVDAARAAGAQAVVCSEGHTLQAMTDALRAQAPEGIDHVVEVDLAGNLELDLAVLRIGGRIAAYASARPEPALPFWPLVFQNISLHFLGSDDFLPAQRQQAADDLNRLLATGWRGIRIASRRPLADVVQAHLDVERQPGRGRVLLDISPETVPCHPA